MVKINRTTRAQAPAAPVSENLVSRKRRSAGSRRAGRLKTFTGRLLVLMVFISAIPVASNRPAWWLIWTFLLGLCAMAYLTRARLLLARDHALQISRYGALLPIALLVPAYAVLQSLPISGYLPEALQALPSLLGAELRPASLSVMPDASFLGAIRALGYLVFLVLVIEIGTQPERSQTLVLLLMIGLLLHAIFALISLRLLNDYALWGEKTVYLGVLTGTFVNRNSIATFLGFGLILALAIALARGQRSTAAEKDRGHAAFLTPERLEIIGLWMAILLFAFAILLTQSRMGAAATAFGAFVTFFALRLHFQAGLVKTLLQGALALVAVLIVLIPVSGGDVAERALFTLVESSVRLELYRQTWGMILERPFTGYGYDAFAPAFELYRDEPLVTQSYADLAHNTYLTLWVEQGFVIGSIPMVLTLWAVAIIIRRLKDGQGDAAVNAAGLGVIALGAMHSLADFSLEIPANVYCFLLIVGLALSPTRQTLSSASSTDATRVAGGST